MDPIFEIIYGQDAVWQIPPDPKAVLFLAHGKGEDPFGYFDPGPNCRQCYGLPEQRAAVLAALKRSYAIISVKSVGIAWDIVDDWPPSPTVDRTIVVSIIKEWTAEHSLDHLPLAVFGFSNGGNFSSQLTWDLDIKSLILMCSSGRLNVLEHANAAVFPPTLYLGMPVDGGPTGFYTKAIFARNILKSRGVRTEMIDILPRPIRPSNFSEKIPCLSQPMSEQIYEAYKAESWLDDHDFVVKSLIEFDYEAVLWKNSILPVCQMENDLCFAKQVRQELSLAFAFHEFTSEYNDQIFKWLDDTLFLGSSEPSRLSASHIVSSSKI